MKHPVNDFFAFLEAAIGNPEFLAVVNTASCLLKISLLSILIYRVYNTPLISKTKKRSFVLIATSLVCAILCDSTWIVKLYSLISSTPTDYRIVLLLIRIAWAGVVLNFHALSLLLESMPEPNYRYPKRHYLLSCISGCLVLFFVHAVFFNFHCFSPAQRPYLENVAEQFISFYVFFILVLPSFCIALYKLYTRKIPVILQKQIRIFMWGLVAPYWIGEFIQSNPFEMFHASFVTHSYAISGLSTLLFTFMLYFSAKKIMGFRFLNITTHTYISSFHKTSFIHNFKTVIGQFGSTTSIHELNNIIQHFLKETFDVQLNKSWLHILFKDDTNQIQVQDERIATVISAFMNHARLATTDLISYELLVYDEIEFSHFYDPTSLKSELLSFLQEINTDIVLPIYDDKKNLFACLIIEKSARNKAIYTRTEQDEMVMFGKYLYNVINLLRNKKVDLLLEQKNHLEHELYLKKQVAAQYQESIRSFIDTTLEKQIGVIFYKNSRFIYANYSAQKMVPHDLNKNTGDQVTKILKKIAVSVESYKIPKTETLTLQNGTSLIALASPHLEQNIVVITLSYPDISDVVRQQSTLLANPHEFDYVLYLSTTKLGIRINELIPINDSIFFNFKIELLKLALSKKALLLTMPNDDLIAVVELLNHVHSATQATTIEITKSTDQVSLAIELFGINPLFGQTHLQQNKPLLRTLHDSATLFLKNIDLLSIEIQEHLLEYIKTGWFRPIKSTNRSESKVRIICSSNQDLSLLASKGLFNHELYKELHKTTLSLPSLISLPEQAIDELTDTISTNLITNGNLAPLLALNKREKATLISQRPSSLYALKKRIHSLIAQKAKQESVQTDSPLMHDFLDINDPDLITAARLGKHALKDSKMMSMLWHKLSGNQNKIAALLGVNRSSVNRRCRAYNLQ